MVESTGEPYSYTADDPTNQSDPTGEWTEGWCAQLSLSAVIGGVGAMGCLEEANGNQQVGLAITGGDGFSIPLNSSRWINFVNSPSESTAWKLFGASGSATFGYEISNANAVTALSGPFSEHSITLGIEWGGTAAYFTGATSEGLVSGAYIGGGVAAGAALSHTSTSTLVRVLSGSAASAVASVITGLNEEAFPLRSFARWFISEVAGDSPSPLHSTPPPATTSESGSPC
jgi:hypothetical protein